MRFTTREAATQFGKDWLKTMPKRKGWKLRVWENLGWHFSLVNGPVSVYYSEWGTPTPFHCMIASSVDERGSGSGEWTGPLSPRSARTPLRALKLGIKVANDAMEATKNRFDLLQTKLETVL